MIEYTTINIDFINVDIIFIYKKKTYNKYCKKHNVDGHMKFQAVTTVLTNSEHIKFVVGVDNCSDVYNEKALIVHELSHVVTELFSYYGFNCDELRSYLLQYMYVRVMEYYDSLMSKK